MATIMLYRKATLQDLNGIKILVDQHKIELGFVIRSALKESIETSELIVAIDTNTNMLTGFVQYRHRKDNQTTLYNIVVMPCYRQQGIGSQLIEELKVEANILQKQFILLKCPAQLSANTFYERYGFILCGTENGKKRSLKLWKLII